MTATAPPNEDRVIDLLADRALDGLSDVQDRELHELLDQLPSIDVDCMDRAAAALSCVLHTPSAGELPATVRDRLWVDADQWLATVDTSAPRSVAGRIDASAMGSAGTRGVPGVVATLGWLAAAACLLIATVAWFGQTPAQTPMERLALLRAEANDLVEIGWAPAKPDPLVESEDAISGEVIWSPSRQEGYMTFAGLRPNDPTREQYQLWIFDATRNEAHPVDGGVFDVDPGERTVVPIDPRVPVREVTLFAVTVEPPGGVVVSTRERLPLIAQVPQG